MLITPHSSTGSNSTTAATTLSVVKLALSLGESVAEVVARPPVKAAIGAVLKVLELLFNIRGKNKKQASRLIYKLHDLDKRMGWAQSIGGYAEAVPHVEELTRQLENLRKDLMATYNNSTSIINSATIADELRECEESIDDLLASYSVSATLNIENAVSILLSKATIIDANLLQNFQHSNLRNTSIHSPVKSTLSFIDPRGKQVEIPLALCLSFQEFEQYFLLSNRDKLFHSWRELSGIVTSISRRSANLVSSHKSLRTTTPQKT